VIFIPAVVFESFEQAISFIVFYNENCNFWFFIANNN